MRQPTADKWVRAKRTRAHLTQEQLAKETGLTLRDIQRIEQGNLHMPSGKYLAVALYFNATMDEMLYGKVEE